MLCTSLSILHGWKASRFAHGRRYSVGLSVKVGPGLLSLYLWWGKSRLVTSRFSSVSSLSQKPLLRPVCRLWLAGWRSFLLPSPGSVRWHRTAPLAGTLLLAVGWHPTAGRRLAPYCSPSAGTLLLAVGWYPTARRRLAPYCSPSAGTLLLAGGWHPTARRRLAPYCWPSAGTLLLAVGWHPTAGRLLAPYCWPSAGTLLLAVGWHPTATLRLAPYCSSSLASIPSARWLRATFFFPL